MSDRLVTLETFHSFGHACLVVSRLTQAGVYAIVTDEQDLMGFGSVRVQVREADVDRAAAALAEEAIESPSDESEAVPELGDAEAEPFGAELEARADLTDADRLVEAFYPPGPADVPPDLTRPSARYTARVRLLLVGLLLFVLLYMALLAGAVTFTAWAAVHDFGDDGWVGSPVMNLLLGLGGGMLCLFFLKGLFKVRRDDFSRYVEVTPATHPLLFAFIRRVCREVGAPAAARVYVGAEANAAVVYDTSLLSLVVPPGKHLLVGLGLVNAATLSEFKAMVAHEFGHFSQRTLGLGPYVATATRVLWDVVHARDRWDAGLRRWCRIDPRLSFPAWGVWGTVWVLRHLLGGVFRHLVAIDMSVRREMEYNADDVAVAAAGSDALPHVLHRLEGAAADLSAAGQALQTAAAHGRISRDLFHHKSAARDRRHRRRPGGPEGTPPSGPRPCVFPTTPPIADPTPPDAPQTHPANHEREANAKRHYLAVRSDDRPAWLLFRDADTLRAEVTRRFYANELETPWERPGAAVNVQAFIDAELDETTYDPKYDGLYDDRPVWPGDGDAGGPADLETFFPNWPDPSGAKRATEYCQLRTEAQFLTSVERGGVHPVPKTVRFRGSDHPRQAVPTLLDQVHRGLAAARQALEALDRRTFAAHAQAARDLDGGTGALMEELLDRARFHLRVQRLLDRLEADDDRVRRMLAFLTWRAGTDMRLFNQIVKTLREVTDGLSACLREADQIHAPDLAHVPAGTPLGELVRVPTPAVPMLPTSVYTIEPSWIRDYFAVKAGVQGRLTRVRAKSLGRILRLHEHIAERWRAEYRPL